jgi:hypothetical protein
VTLLFRLTVLLHVSRNFDRPLTKSSDNRRIGQYSHDYIRSPHWCLVNRCLPAPLWTLTICDHHMNRNNITTYCDIISRRLNYLKLWWWKYILALKIKVMLYWASLNLMNCSTFTFRDIPFESEEQLRIYWAAGRHNYWHLLKFLANASSQKRW